MSEMEVPQQKRASDEVHHISFRSHSMSRGRYRLCEWFLGYGPITFVVGHFHQLITEDEVGSPLPGDFFLF